MTGRRMATEESTQILQAMLDMFPYPVWISDSENSLILNEAAQGLVSQGFSLNTVRNVREDGLITYRGKKFQVQKREMNHGTGCLLHELRLDDEPSRRMRECSERLSKVLERCQA